jgi:MFS family permease
MNGKFQRLKTKLAVHPARKRLILSTVLIGATMSALDVSIINVAMPTLKSIFGVSLAVIEWTVMAYMLTLTIFLPLFGRLADIYGRSRLYNIGFVVFSGGSLLCGLSGTAMFLILSRVVQAIGAGLLQANSVALITDAFPSGERGKAIGLQVAVQAIAMSVGPFVGGILIATVGWRSIFYLNIPIGILGTLAALLILPADGEIKENLSLNRSAISSWIFIPPSDRAIREIKGKKEKIDYLGAAFFASGLALVILAFNEGVKLGWGSDTIITYFLSGAILLTLFVFTELRVDHPLIDLRLFKNVTFLLGNLTSMLSYYVLFAIMFLVPFYLERVLGYSVALTGSLLTPLLLAMAAVAPFSGYISDKYGGRIMTTSGMLISAMACFSLIFMGESANLPVLATVLISLGVGMGLFTTPNNSAIMGSAPSDKLGVAGGVLNMTRSLGLIFGVNMSGVIFTSLQHRYLAEKGYLNVQNVFSNGSIPTPVKANAFMHGFLMVIMVLMAVTVLSAFLSSVRKIKTSAIVDHEAAGTAVASSGFFHGFDRQAGGMGLFIMIVLFAGIIFSFASSRIASGSYLASERPAISNSCVTGQEQKALEAQKLAMAYYAKKYNDSRVDIDVVPRGNHMEADVRKNGELVKRLAIHDGKVTEQGTGMRDWAFDLLMDVN